MIPTRGILAGLVVLQLSAGLDAFYMCPFHKPLTVSCRGVDVPLARARPRPQNPPAAARSSRGGITHGSALRMAEDMALDIALADLEDREFQLEELEDRDVAVTSVVLKKDGTIDAGATNGPLPLSCRGKWAFKDKTFSMEISREFDASIPYTVSRVLTGYVDEVLPATDTIIITGDIVMEGMDVGFFKMISAPSDILDSLERLDKMVERVNVRE